MLGVVPSSKVAVPLIVSTFELIFAFTLINACWVVSFVENIKCIQSFSYFKLLLNFRESDVISVFSLLSVPVILRSYVSLLIKKL